MPYSNVIDRTDATPLIPEEVVDAIYTKATDESAAMTLFKHVQMSRKVDRLPVLSALPTAYWVTGDTGRIQTSEVNWANKYLTAEKIAVIVPVPNDVLDDADYPIWDAAMPLIAEAVARTLDSAVFFGTNAPASFPTNIVAAAVAAGNTFTEASTAAQGGIFGDLDSALATLEADGYDPDGWVAARSLRARLRAARSTQGEAIDRDRISPQLSEFDGNPLTYPMRGLFPSAGAAGTNVRAIAIERDQFILGIRKDVSWEVSKEAVIMDNTGAVQFNTFQDEVTALKCTFRAGWQVANPINYDQTTEANRYPAAVVRY